MRCGRWSRQTHRPLPRLPEILKTVATTNPANKAALLVLLGALALIGGVFAAIHLGPGSTAGGKSISSGTLLQTPRTLPAFSLTDELGQPFGAEQLRGHWTLLFPGFTYCPDVCPTTLATLANAQKQWASLPEARRPRLLFVSVDPDRDTPQRTGEYAHYFHPDTWAATAAPEPLAEFARAMGLVYMKVPLAGGDYTMDHSATLVVLDPQGRQAGLVGPPLKWQDIANDMARLAEDRP